MNANDPQLIEKVTKMAGSFRQFRYYVLLHGLDPREFLEACDAILGRGGPTPVSEAAGADASKLVEIITSFAQKVTALPDFPTEQDPSRARGWFMACGLFNMMLDPASPQSVDDSSERDVARAAAREFYRRLEAAVQRGEDVAPIFEDLELFLATETGAVERRLKMFMARIMIYGQQMPQAKWDALDAKQKLELYELFQQWRGEHREEFLSTLPIEDRRKLEAMEQWGPEDWESFQK